MNKAEVIGMRLEDVVNAAKCNVKLGAEDGTSFIFCGDPRTQALNLDKLSEGSLEDLKNELRRAEETLELRKSCAPTPEEYITHEFEKSEGEFCGNWDGYVKYMKRYFVYLNNLVRKINKINIAIDEFVDLKDRPVTDIYKSLSEENTIIILFKGREKGMYWDIEEYLEGVNASEEEDKDDE